MYSDESLRDSQLMQVSSPKRWAYQAHRVVQREATDCEDLADGDNDVTEEEELHFPVAS
jgi:hypothetical protein